MNKLSLSNVNVSFNTIIGLGLFSLLIIALIDVYSLFFYIYTLIIFIILDKLLFGNRLYKYNLFCFHIYLILGISIYCIQYINLPEYMGLTGPEGSIGTDDIRYYERITNLKLTVHSGVSVSWIPSYPFSDFLRILCIFPVRDPLNVVIVNLLGIAWLPYLTFRLCELYTNNYRVSCLSANLILLCPFIWSNGVIIMRDVWVTTLLIAVLVCLLQKKFISAIVCSGLICYLRFGSLVFVLLGCIVIFGNTILRPFKTKIQKYLIFSLIIISITILFILLFPTIQKLSGGKLEDGLFRESFTDMLIAMDSNGTITKLVQLPFLIRTPLLIIFFLFAPFLRFKILTLGVFNIRMVLDTILTPIWMILTISPFFKSFWISIYKNLPINQLISILFLFALALSTVSLQVRHKTVMLPIWAIIAAYGCISLKSKNKWMFPILSSGIFILELFMALK